MSDDGYIYIRVVNQLLAGHGPVFNQGERVETTASPLWLGMVTFTKLALPPISAPWIAVLLGLLLSVAGLAFAQWGAYRLWKSQGRAILPLGALVVAALPPFWEFATSGLETGLAFVWLGASFWGLARLLPDRNDHSEANSAGARANGSSRPGADPPFWLGALIGLGVLIRPDFGLFVLAFMAVLLFFCRHRPVRCLQLTAVALALPLAYQVFRMGYYASIVPNPALTKEASSADWSRGWTYLVDTIKPYWLPLPLLLALVGGLMPWPLRPPRWNLRLTERAFIVAAVITAGLAHGLYCVYVGGDFMHARFLLPAIFVLMMPVAVIALDAPPRVFAVASVLVWAIVCVTTLRVPYPATGPDLIANERGYYAKLAGVSHPITLDDYAASFFAQMATRAKTDLQPDSLMLLWQSTVLRDCPDDPTCYQLPLGDGLPSDGAIAWPTIGIFSNTVGIDVHVIDNLSLADPLGSHLELTRRNRPGHEKLLPSVWIVGRFADSAAHLPPGPPPPEGVAAAREALSCGRIPELLTAVTGDMTPARFAHNFVDSFALYRFRFPPGPQEARERLC